MCHFPGDMQKGVNIHAPRGQRQWPGGLHHIFYCPCLVGWDSFILIEFSVISKSWPKITIRIFKVTPLSAFVCSPYTKMPGQATWRLEKGFCLYVSLPGQLFLYEIINEAGRNVLLPDATSKVADIVPVGRNICHATA